MRVSCPLGACLMSPWGAASVLALWVDGEEWALHELVLPRQSPVVGSHKCPSNN